MIHSCSYYCELPACIKEQRDFLRDLAEQNAAPQPVRSIAVEETQAGVGKAAAVAAPTPVDRLLEKALAEKDAQMTDDEIVALAHKYTKPNRNPRREELIAFAHAVSAEKDAEIARLRDLCLRAAGWVEDMQCDFQETEREKRVFVEQLEQAARKETK